MIKIVAEHFVKEESRDSFMALARDLVNEWQDTNAIKAHNSSIHFSRIVPQLRECAAKAGNSCFYDELY